MAEELKTSVGKIVENSITVAARPMTSHNPVFIASICGSIGMYIVDHNGLLSIPAPIVWLPLALCFAPLAIVLAILLFGLVAWLVVMLLIGVVLAFLKVLEGVAWTLRKFRQKKVIRA